MKKPFLAFIFNFLLPGAGLAYLGKWKWAVINLVGVLAIGFTMVVVLSEETFAQWIWIVAMGCGGGSGGLAQTLATQMNQKVKPSEKRA